MTIPVPCQHPEQHAALARLVEDAADLARQLSEARELIRIVVNYRANFPVTFDGRRQPSEWWLDRAEALLNREKGGSA